MHTTIRSNSVVRVCVAYLLSILAAELIAQVSSPWGAVFHIAILFSFIVHAALVWEHPFYKLLLALSLAPLIRVVGITMPVSEFSDVYAYLLISIPILAGTFGFIKLLHFHPVDIGFNLSSIPLQVIVAISGIGFGLANYLILEPEPLISELTLQNAIVPALILFVSVGFMEELVFRGVMQRMAGLLGSWGWVYIAVLYSVLQIGSDSVLYCLVAFEMALLYGWVVKQSGSLLGVTVSHGLMSIYLYLIFPFVFS